MNGRVAMVAVTVLDYDEAISFYVGVLGFELLEDTEMGGGKRWVRVSPPSAGDGGAEILLARAVNDAQRASVGNQTGGRVFLFVETDEFWGEYARLKKCGVKFEGEAREEEYGNVVVFEDLYGNRIDLIGRS